MTVLVSLAYDGGVATVRRDADGTWLDHTLIDDRRVVYEGAGDGFAVAGLLPPGASHAVVEGRPAATGGGAWLAVTDHRLFEPAVWRDVVGADHADRRRARDARERRRWLGAVTGGRLRPLWARGVRGGLVRRLGRRRGR